MLQTCKHKISMAKVHANNSVVKSLRLHFDISCLTFEKSLALLNLDQNDLRSLGLSLGHMKKLLARIQSLRGGAQIA